MLLARIAAAGRQARVRPGARQPHQERPPASWRRPSPCDPRERHPTFTTREFTHELLNEVLHRHNPDRHVFRAASAGHENHLGLLSRSTSIASVTRVSQSRLRSGCKTLRHRGNRPHRQGGIDVDETHDVRRHVPPQGQTRERVFSQLIEKSGPVRLQPESIGPAPSGSSRALSRRVGMFTTRSSISVWRWLSNPSSWVSLRIVRT